MAIIAIAHDLHHTRAHTPKRSAFAAYFVSLDHASLRRVNTSYDDIKLFLINMTDCHGFIEVLVD